MKKKLITCLDVRDGKLTKGVKFLDNKDLGDPVEAARKYNADGIDEIVLYDFTATHEQRGITLDLVKRVAQVVTVPFGVGGGIKSLDDIYAALEAGADKVHINSAAVQTPDLLTAAVKQFGGTRIVLSTDVLETDAIPSGYEIVINGGRTRTGIDAIEWVKRGEATGVCEIVVNSIDGDGTQEGFHIPKTRAISEAVSIPVVASGGGGTVQHIYDVLTEGKATTALVASMLHFGTYTVQRIKQDLAALGIIEI